MTASVAAPSRLGVLIVDDDDDTRDIVSTFLEAHGYPVVAARNGEEAWGLLGSTAPCVILLDLMMPVMDGWTLRRRLLEDPMLATIPIVVISATYDARHAASTLGAAAGLQKPLDLPTLLSTIGRYC